MVRPRLLPLGIDLGSSRIRVASAIAAQGAGSEIVGVASREAPEGAMREGAIVDADTVAAVIDDLRRELRTPHRRCVLSLPASVAALRIVRFPKMSDSERRSAARFESERIAPWNSKEVATVVRAHWVNAREGLVAVGVAREEAVRSRTACVRRAGLSVVGIDHDACALRRAFPFADAVLDVGHRSSTLHAFSHSGPISVTVPAGGHEVTAGICRDLGIESFAAERRKRILGTAGAGETARDAFAALVATAVQRVREKSAVRRLAMTGNGARLAGLAAAIEAATAAVVDVPVSDLLRGSAYPDDVTRSAAPDWTLAASLCAWERP